MYLPKLVTFSQHSGYEINNSFFLYKFLCLWQHMILLMFIGQMSSNTTFYWWKYCHQWRKHFFFYLWIYTMTQWMRPNNFKLDIQLTWLGKVNVDICIMKHHILHTLTHTTGRAGEARERHIHTHGRERERDTAKRQNPFSLSLTWGWRQSCALADT